MSFMGLFRNIILRGSKWSARKSGEYMIRAFAELQRDTDALGMTQINDAISRCREHPEFEQGVKHAELNFGAMFGLIKATDADPIVVKARMLARDFQMISSGPSSEGDPDAGFKIAVANLTVRQKLQEMYPQV
ncbi:hypothetical protein ACX9MO_13395 [Pseudooceanicola sp. 502str34]